MRFRLRTRLIVLATAPVALALPWLNEPAVFVTVVVASPFLLYLWVVTSLTKTAHLCSVSCWPKCLPWVPSRVDMCSERTQEIERQNRQGATSDCLVARERTTGVESSKFCSVGSTESWAKGLPTASAVHTGKATTPPPTTWGMERLRKMLRDPSDFEWQLQDHADTQYPGDREENRCDDDT